MRKFFFLLFAVMMTSLVQAQQQPQIPEEIAKNPEWMKILTTISDDLTKYMQDMQSTYARMLSDSSLTEESKTEKIKEFGLRQHEGITSKIVKYIEENNENPVGGHLLSCYYMNMSIDKVRQLLQKIPGHLMKGDVVKVRDYVDIVTRTSPGQPFIDFSMPTPEGKQVKLSDEIQRNKVSLIDFWASWCGPCKAEMPHVIKAYNAFKDKGFGIVGVSLDDKAERWTKAISDWGMPWTHISDLKGWKCEGAALYGVHAIPASFLIGQDGKIIAVNLRGEGLSKKLSELLGLKE